MEVLSLIVIVYSIHYTGENDYVCFWGGGREVKLFYIRIQNGQLWCSKPIIPQLSRGHEQA
jgi:hypothetical protein